MADPAFFNYERILDSLNDGVYVTDRERRIVYWSPAAERITGWPAEEILGKRCCDNILCHIDKDGHPLCGEEYCPLHRSMITGERNKTPVLVFAKSKDGKRIPTQVSVAPIRNEAGEVVGGVEIFRDFTEIQMDLERARKIQRSALARHLPRDPRIAFTTHYIPLDIIGGDFYAIEKTGPDTYAFLLADVSGHGIAAALYTMHLKSLWIDNLGQIGSPCRFLESMNRQLRHLFQDNASFATGILGVADLEREQVILVSAGNPFPLFVNESGGFDVVRCSGFPLGMMDDSEYEETVLRIHPGSRLLLFSDGATEVFNSEETLLGGEGLKELLQKMGYPGPHAGFKEIEEALLRYSNGIRLDDDLTFLEIHYLGRGRGEKEMGG